MIKQWKTFEIAGVLNKFYDTFERAEGMYSSLLITSDKRDLERKRLEDFKCKEFISKKELKALILQIDFEGAISTRELLKEIGYNAPDLNSRSSDEDSLNKGYEVNQNKQSEKGD